MKRLQSKLTRKVLAAFKVARIIRLAEWQDVSIGDPNVVQYVTDAMASGAPVQINYEGSGWRTIYPYGWNTSKAGNVLIMCYKDTGEIRSYRMDRVLDLQVDSDTQPGQDYEQQEQQNNDIPQNDMMAPETVAPRPEEEPFTQQIDTLMQDNTPEMTEEDVNQEAVPEDQPQVEQQEEQPAQDEQVQQAV